MHLCKEELDDSYRILEQVIDGEIDESIIIHTRTMGSIQKHRFVYEAKGEYVTCLRTLPKAHSRR